MRTSTWTTAVSVGIILLPLFAAEFIRFPLECVAIPSCLLFFLLLGSYFLSTLSNSNFSAFLF
jgi:hypothetical protein